MRDETHLSTIAFCAVITLLIAPYATAGTWTELKMPGANFTIPERIDGGNVVGYYYDGSISHGFLYNGATWTPLDMPGINGVQTTAMGINGSKIVGYYVAQNLPVTGFIKNGSTWTTLPVGGAADISGSNIVGVTSPYSYIYDGTNIKTLAKPGSSATIAKGIDGSNIVGTFNDDSGSHGFIYDGSTWSTLDKPGAYTTVPYDIDGHNIVGIYQASSTSAWNGFLYNGSTWTTINLPGAFATQVSSISGNNIVGLCYDSAGQHGFLYTIPEPATILLLGLGAIVLRRKK
jgi:hypothetical protein